ncbi:MAG TPA: UvrD-helicase domain-containing protein [Gemmatimonadales bacterium]|jgi:DNA helicase-2/ATP-dependent DNA helicase PcrA|nr:UvrD-helicase domain-containing protein [Gemmatimonadales bacterium]
MTVGSPGRDWARTLNSEQREAVAHVRGPLLVLAGAGSGKTRVLTTRIAMLIEEHGVPAERIFAVTFTNKAAGEMKQRVATLLARDPAGLWIGTFHSLSARLLRRDAERLGFSRQFTIFDEDDRLALIRRLLEERNVAPKLFPPRAVQAVISSAKNRMLNAEQLAASAGFDQLTRIAADLMDPLAAGLKRQNAMDFDDLMLHPLTLFREHPDRLAWWRQRFGFILVDEFQDTNRAQYQLVRALGAHGNVFAVGDDDQSIYGWRGAEVKNMREFQRDFPAARVVRLEENYRSTQVILDAANAAIARNQSRLGKTLRTRRAGGESVTVVAAADERDEAEWIAGELARRSAAGDWPLTEMVVLYRTNAQSRALEEACRRSGVAYRVVGAISFYERREVKDLLAYLRLVANQQDDEAFLRAVAVPRRGIGDASLETFRDAAAGWGKPLLETARIADRITGLRPNVRESLQRFAALVDGLRARSAAAAPALLIEELLQAIDYEGTLLAEGPEGADRWENVRELVAGAAEWSEIVSEDDGTTPLERFLAEAALVSAADSSQGSDGVTLMTLHTAKGLEWPVVVLSGLEDGLFPLGRAMESTEGLEEERRLFYVGLTRAKDKLYLTWARARRRGGELRPGMVSRFLESIPAELLEERSTASLWAPRRRSGGWLAPWEVTTVPRAAPTRLYGMDEEQQNQDAPRLIKGERVHHRRFGSGTVQGLSGAGKDLKVSVRFDDEAVGLKQLLVAFAGLERDWGEGA